MTQSYVRTEPVVAYHHDYRYANESIETNIPNGQHEVVQSPKQYWVALQDPEMDKVFNEPPKKKRVSFAPTVHMSSSTSAPTVVDEPYTRQFIKLHQMGFHDNKKNELLLMKYDGDVDKVIHELLGNTEPIKDQKHKKYSIRYDYIGDNKYEIDILDSNNRIVNTAHMNLYFKTRLSNNNGPELVITKEELHVHPTYAVSSASGPLIGTCTQRFKMSKNKKYNYKLTNGTVLKMTGATGSDFEIKRNGSVVATIHPNQEQSLDVFIKPKLTKDQHIFAMCLIMLDRQLTKGLS